MANTTAKAADGSATASLHELVKIAGLPASAADSVEITGADPVFATRYKIVAPGAAVIAATGVAAAELWKLKTGRQQRVRVDGRMAGAAMGGARYLKNNRGRPPENPRKNTRSHPL